eukprot:CAMPEP_0174255242 /NCGR_PEP_ID=MMETSP0439-20130205/4586_1 /TAXON_ID=0 /ORGANISM="Stereomyxa ramosa, Strain Chinc5" /LENGTH=152 /DNA_ID=CAMNT_0015337339 /DNA_START=18 /DNA_END=476 /DNA_ORIENTATION=-
MKVLLLFVAVVSVLGLTHAGDGPEVCLVGGTEFRWLEEPTGEYVVADENAPAGTKIARFLPNSLTSVLFYVSYEGGGEGKRDSYKRGEEELFEIDEDGYLVVGYELGFPAEFGVSVEVYKCFDPANINYCDPETAESFCSITAEITVVFGAV